MSQVDWSKAPEGATHWEPDLYAPAGFMRQEGETWLYWPVIQSENTKWEYYGEISGARAEAMIPRPSTQEWTGTGLPPVGVRVAIVDDGSLVYGQGESGEVIAHVEDCAVVRMSYGLGCFTAKHLRTPEQIAADEREKAIQEIVRAMGGPQAVISAETIAARLHDAGYRKQEKADAP